MTGGRDGGAGGPGGRSTGEGHTHLLAAGAGRGLARAARVARGVVGEPVGATHGAVVVRPAAAVGVAGGRQLQVALGRGAAVGEAHGGAEAGAGGVPRGHGGGPGLVPTALAGGLTTRWDCPACSDRSFTRALTGSWEVVTANKPSPGSHCAPHTSPQGCVLHGLQVHPLGHAGALECQVRRPRDTVLLQPPRGLRLSRTAGARGTLLCPSCPCCLRGAAQGPRPSPSGGRALRAATPHPWDPPARGSPTYLPL